MMMVGPKSNPSSGNSYIMLSFPRDSNGSAYYGSLAIGTTASSITLSLTPSSSF